MFPGVRKYYGDDETFNDANQLQFSNIPKIIAELSTFISFASISAETKYKKDIVDCAEWIARHLSQSGMQHVKVINTSKHPIVFGEWMNAPGKPTVLIYGHYDVQPADPLQQWDTAPFKATVKGDYILGRGASDDKGQIFIHIKAIESILQETGTLPVNVKFLIEGAEEIGSVALKDFITANTSMLQCDAAVVSDTKMAGVNTPAITCSLRGSLNAEVFLQSAATDLHSGTFGGAVPNAAFVVSQFINSLYNKDGSIAIAGFYDDVKNVTPAERNFIAVNAPPGNSLLKDAGVLSAWGEKKYTIHERTTIRPSLSVTGITSGYQGEGVKNIIPARASLKLNLRLVPYQRPEKIKELLNGFIQTAIPSYIKVTVEYSALSNPVLMPVNNKFITAAVNAYKTVFKNKVRMIGSGGTIAAVDHLYSFLKVPVVFMGFAQASDNMHAPNEKMYLPNFFKGINVCRLFIKNISSFYYEAN
ncbi:MAG: dipeptidase [Chitinophagaceae bacterium]|nr:dipeptidase [Chitinophagaceae bacterium]